MLILGIESSCDETGAAVIKADKNQKRVELLSNTVATSLLIHSKTGGIIPENAAREQIKYIIPVIKKALKDAKTDMNKIDAIAVTIGPGLVGSLLIGVETAKTLSFIYNKPLIPTNHLYGHIYANFIEQTHNSELITHNSNIEFPVICLVVSGGHTDLVLMKHHRSIKWLGGTRDDAAGEAFDKIGRLLSLPYPGGPHIEKAAKKGEANRFNFPSPLINSNDYDFSFSGLKTAALRTIEKIEKLDDKTKSDISLAVQTSIIDVLVKKTLRATKDFGAKSILLGGGVAANSSLRENFKFQISNFKLNTKLFVPEKWLCTDNGAMIASAAFYNDKSQRFNEIDANPNLHFYNS